MPLASASLQSSLPGLCPITDALERLAHHSDHDERGAVYTRREVVEFMLDLAGYTTDRPLHRQRLLEPSFGGGEFLLAAVERLLRAHRSAGGQTDLAPCIRAVELHRSSHASTEAKLLALLLANGLAATEARRLASAWLIHGDFLLCELEGRFDYVVGNPPYVRQELIPAPLLAEYRRRFASLYDRADLYVPFIERSLGLLKAGGQFSFICADRWTKNKYGGPLRAMVTKDFHLKAYVDMLDTPAFDADVIAYPAITLIERAPAGATLVAKPLALDPAQLASLARQLRTGTTDESQGVAAIERIGQGSEPWVLSASGKRALLRRLEATFPSLEEAGCKVGIGVINPFEDDGSLADLARHPKLRAYLERHRAAIAGRHVAKKSPASWYRTIDRITPALATRPKMLIPDIKGSAHVAFESGQLYPHHNLYYVVSDDWDLRALQAVLLSAVARQFVAAYSTTMRGGFLRFQAQYLRRIRVPRWAEVGETMRSRLIEAAQARDLRACDAAAFELFGLDADEMKLLAE